MDGTLRGRPGACRRLENQEPPTRQDPSNGPAGTDTLDLLVDLEWLFKKATGVRRQAIRMVTSQHDGRTA